VEDVDEVGKPHEGLSRLACRGYARPREDSGEPEWRLEVDRRGGFGCCVDATLLESSWEEPVWKHAGARSRTTTLKGTETQESIGQIVGFTAGGFATDSLRGAKP
jgi:hypothetical protein